MVQPLFGPCLGRVFFCAWASLALPLEKLLRQCTAVTKTMPRLIPKGQALTSSVAVRLPQTWLDEIDYLAELQGLRLSQQLRELIQVGGSHCGLDLDE